MLDRTAIGGYTVQNSSPQLALFNFNVDRRFKDCTDGLANTVAVSELIAGTSSDVRGDWWHPWGAQYEHLYGPNTANYDVLSSGGYCVSTTTTPCQGSMPSFGQQIVSARSYHPGGVNTLRIDGSVQFIIDEVSLATWQALGSMNGGEVLAGAGL